ncbi:hypothetical protein PILCRDRAFT_13366 [Piloderma croceum F 1598]|uniref:Uncharacterized protein n=1 Tax=Piloderma croceum (strain F 1598) TaxID=765440 RepID=A0A0C3ET68_PILCF|nr:hypothetical protein PILCRDRAFT_13366 [Piloderma croceum F 1598]
MNLNILSPQTQHKRTSYLHHTPSPRPPHLNRPNNSNLRSPTSASPQIPAGMLTPCVNVPEFAILAGSPSPKQKLGGLVKKEPRDLGIARRNSVSSTSSSVHSSNGPPSNWDDNVSFYSNSSGPPSSYNSPSVSTFPIPRDPNSQSPPSGGIRLPLTDIASLQPQTPPSAGIPTSRKAATAPYYNNTYPTPPGSANGPGSHRRDITDQSTGWQNVPMADISPASEVGRQTTAAT